MWPFSWMNMNPFPHLRFFCFSFACDANDRVSGELSIECQYWLSRLTYRYFIKKGWHVDIQCRYIPLFDYFKDFSDTAFRVVADDYVTSDSGTGIVHCAPAFGEDDYRVCIGNHIIKKVRKLMEFHSISAMIPIAWNRVHVSFSVICIFAMELICHVISFWPCSTFLQVSGSARIYYFYFSMQYLTWRHPFFLGKCTGITSGGAC